MLVDAFTQVSSAQALTGNTLVGSEDYIDLTHARDIGIGEPLALVVNVKVAMGGTGSPTLTVTVELDDNTSFSSATTVASSAAVAAAGLPIGAQIVVPIPPFSYLTKTDPAAAEYRYLRAAYTMAGTSPTITVDAQVMKLSQVQLYRHYPDNVTIS